MPTNTYPGRLAGVAVVDAIVEFVPDFSREICDVEAPASMP
jgi:hypothetical protein